MANPYTLELVIQELLHNALKFTQDGGEVKVAVLERQNQVVLVVKDNGIGIPLDKQSIIFSGFYEIQDVMNHKSSSAGFMGGGMGIGLSLVKETLTTMKGKIELFSEPGKGSSFFIFFPKYSANKINHSNGSSNQPETRVIDSDPAPKLI
ncbi:MAG: sensor histidine kinase, partial [Calditrichia bacterium]